MLPWSATLEPPGAKCLYNARIGWGRPTLECYPGAARRRVWAFGWTDMRAGAAYPGTRAQNHRHRGCPSGSPRCKWRTGLRFNFCFRFSFFKLFCFSRLSSLFPVQSAYPRADKQIMPTLECYPGARYLYIYAYVREGPTLELPWSYAPVYMRRPPTLELP